ARAVEGDPLRRRGAEGGRRAARRDVLRVEAGAAERGCPPRPRCPIREGARARLRPRALRHRFRGTEAPGLPPWVPRRREGGGRAAGGGPGGGARSRRLLALPLGGRSREGPARLPGGRRRARV